MKRGKDTYIYVLVPLMAMLFYMPLYAKTAATPVSQAMPKGLWQAYHEARHKVEPFGGEQQGKTYRAVNHSNNLVMQFNSQSLTLQQSGKHSPWQLTMQLQAYGQQAMVPVQQASLEVAGRRISYHRGNISEWYINHNKGFEQGFTLNSEPENYQPDQPVRVSLGIEGSVQPQWKQDGQALDFYDNEQQKAFSYSKLEAFDATGKALPVQMYLADQQITLEVTATGAAWPITIDPLFYTETKVTVLESDAAANDFFGMSVALDGDTAIIGANSDDDAGTNSGSAYVFTRAAGNWSFNAKLTASDAAAGDLFGEAVALSGNTALIGAPHDDDGGSQSGSAYVFVEPVDGWNTTYETAKLTASDASLNDWFGGSVALDGDTALIGAYQDDVGDTDSGSAYVFVRPLLGGWATTNTETAKLTASDASFNDQFGYSVALDGGTALVGAHLDNDTGTGGSAYVFVKSLLGNWATGTETAKLTASDATGSDQFGHSVALSGFTALVGAWVTESAYVFVNPGTGWVTGNETAKLTASDATPGDWFGRSVVLSGDTALIGAKQEGVGGSAYVFVKPGGGWATGTETAKLLPSHSVISHQFGQSVALSGDTALIGGIGDLIGSGSAYLFDKPAGGWAFNTEDAKLRAVVSQENRYFGYSSAIDGDTALIGAVGDNDIGTNSGAAFIFERSGSTWEHSAKLTASDAAASNSFGNSVALSGNTALVGAYHDDTVGTNSGSAYVFVKPASGWVTAQETAKLIASDAATNDMFGSSVALSADTALIGAMWNAGGATFSGSAYVFVKSGSGWISGTEAAKLTASDAAATNQFGHSVALSDDVALIGAPQDDGGSAYVYVKPGGGWANSFETAKLSASNTTVSDQFGHSVALAGNTALVGAYVTESAYVFVNPGTGWLTGNETAKLTTSDADVGDHFGWSVAISGNTALIGAIHDADGGSNTGSAYVYVKPGGGWANSFETAKLTASDAATGDAFGHSVALSGDTALIGADLVDAGASDSGAAYFNRFKCGFSGSVATSRWTMIAVPCDLGAANTVGDVLSDDFNSLDYQWTWVVYAWDEPTENYILQGLSSPLELGKSYWIFSQNGGYWDAGDGALTTFTQSGNCASPRGCYEIDLVVPVDGSSVRYNMVGQPGNIQSDWASVRFLVDGVLYTPFTAELNGFVTNTLWKYNGNGYDSYDDNTPGMEGYLDTYDGIWVKVLGGSFGKTVKMLIPHGSSTGSPPGPPGGGIGMLEGPLPESKQSFLARLVGFFIASAQAAKPTWDQEWYLRLTVTSEAENLRDRNNVLGQLEDSINGVDRRDLPELSPFGTPYLSLSFPIAGPSGDVESYASNYHLVDTGAADQWVFEVKSDNSGRDITLYWDGVYLLEGIWTQDNGKKTWSQSKQMDMSKLYNRMVLEDIDLGLEVDAMSEGAVNSYSFNMNGLNVRTFRWVMKGKNGKHPKKKAFNASRGKVLHGVGIDPMKIIPHPGRGVKH